MKSSKLLSCLIAVVLAFGIAVAGIGCLVTAFTLKPVDMPAVILVCALCAASCGVCFSTKRLWWLPALPAALLIGYLIRTGTLLQELEALLFRISGFYNMAYGWGTVRWSGAELGHVPVTGGLALMAAVVAAATSWVVCRRKSAFFAVALGFLPLAACFVVTDTIPDEGWVMLLLGCFCLLALTQSVRRRDPKGAVRLTALLLVPVVLASSLLLWLNPKNGYEAQMKAVQQTLLSWLRDLPFVMSTPDGELTISVDGIPGTQVDLSSVGPKLPLHYAVMDVTAEKGGIIYLRGQSFDTYDGLSWSASSLSSGEDKRFPFYMVENGEISISTRSTHGMLYVPYYISGRYYLLDGYMVNTDGKREYSFVQMKPDPERGTHVNYVGIGSYDHILEQCLRLPEATKVRAETILAQSGIRLDDYNTSKSMAQAIADFVSQSAQYDLQTLPMPKGERDFAMWFLEESDTGYCVHFASAATVLLRAVGIPARYVTGYMFEAQSGKRVTVRSNTAHAWVEYYDTYSGWTVLDATPGEWMEETEQTQPQDTTPVATPPATQPPTRPLPMESTPEDTQTAETEPAEGNDEPVIDGEKVDLGPLWTALKYLLCIMGVAAAVAGQYKVRLDLRRKKMHTGHPNQKALARWRYAIRMSRVTKVALPEELETLAEKAKFSQHTLTAQELKAFDVWLQQAQLALHSKPWPVRFAIKLIWAIE